MTLECPEKGADQNAENTLKAVKWVPICCMLVTVMASVNGNFMTPFFSPYATSRNITSQKFSLVEGAGDGVYVFGYLFYLAVSTKKCLTCSN